MCGILGIVNYSSHLPLSKIETINQLTEGLLCAAQIRGTDASGLCILKTNGAFMYKDHLPATQLVNQGGYADIMSKMYTQNESGVFKCMIGHTRAQTKGDRAYNVNNHPIRAGRVIGVHNGVIINDDDLFELYSKYIDRSGKVDSEIIFRLIDYHTKSDGDLVAATNCTHKALEGYYACAFLHLDFTNYLTLFRKNRSNLEVYVFDNASLLMFASTTHIMDRAINQLDNRYKSVLARPYILDIPVDAGLRINLDNGKIYQFSLNDPE